MSGLMLWLGMAVSCLRVTWSTFPHIPIFLCIMLLCIMLSALPNLNVDLAQDFQIFFLQ